VAFDKRTGEVKYKISDELASYASPILATIDGRRWCFAFCRDGLLAFDPTNGRIDFHFPWRAKLLESVNASSPVVVGNEVFITETYGPGGCLLRVKPGECEVVWQDDLKNREKSLTCHWMTPVYCDGYLYGCHGRHDGSAELRCVEWKTGKLMWSEPGLARSCLLLADGRFVCLSEEGTLRLFKPNPERYEPLATTVLRDEKAPPSQFGFGPPSLLKSPAWAAPILSHGLMYVRGKDRVVCVELIPRGYRPDRLFS
jgi:outer membrane protein assembly factor BamB